MPDERVFQEYRLTPDGPLHRIVVGIGYIRVVIFFALAGMSIDGHAHAFDHPSEATKGAVRLITPDVNQLMRPGDEPYNVRAHVQHAIQAEEDNSEMTCTHYHADIDYRNVDLSQGIPLEWLRRLTDLGAFHAHG